MSEDSKDYLNTQDLEDFGLSASADLQKEKMEQNKLLKDLGVI